MNLKERTILIINGPNLNLLGTREPSLYGHKTLAQLQQEWVQYGQVNSFKVLCYQSNHEGALIDFIQTESPKALGLIINGGGYSHTSIALADCVKEVPLTKVEVHISNIFARETYRHHSYLSGVCQASLCGMGTYGYLVALNYIITKNQED